MTDHCETGRDGAVIKCTCSLVENGTPEVRSYVIGTINSRCPHHGEEGRDGGTGEVHQHQPVVNVFLSENLGDSREESHMTSLRTPEYEKGDLFCGAHGETVTVYYVGDGEQVLHLTEDAAKDLVADLGSALWTLHKAKGGTDSRPVSAPEGDLFGGFCRGARDVILVAGVDGATRNLGLAHADGTLITLNARAGAKDPIRRLRP